MANKFIGKGREILQGLFFLGIMNLIVTGGLLLLFNFSANTVIVINAIVFVMLLVLLLKVVDII